MGISWVRAHIGIRGNELADQYAACHSYWVQIAGEPEITTEGGIGQLTKATTAESRAAPTYGTGKAVGWRRRPRAAYTWICMGKVPQAQWLHKIGNTEQPTCPYSPAHQTGVHIVWEYPLHNNE